MATGTSVVAAPAQAHDLGDLCVSKAEFHQVQRGMGMDGVHNVFDVDGRQEYFFGAAYGMPPEQGRIYRACRESYGMHGEVYLSFKRKDGVWRVISKNAYWG
ncbi:MAG: hypothetical protein ACRDOY_00660 [Nocardioidaceae bacterium]